LKIKNNSETMFGAETLDGDNMTFSETLICIYLEEKGVRLPDRIISSADLNPESREMDGIGHPLAGHKVGA